jgi:hypothetical protein
MPRWKRVTSASTRIQQRYPYRQGGPHGFDRSPDDCQCHSGRTGPQVESISVAAARQSHEKPSPALGTRVVQHLCFVGEEASASTTSDRRLVAGQLFPV